MIKVPSTKVFRLSRGSRPWDPYRETKFRARFDDPQKQYFVLYGSSVRLGCFLECLACFREGPTPGLEEILHVDDDYNVLSSGTVPPFWLRGRMIGTASVRQSFADVACMEWIANLRQNDRAVKAFAACDSKEKEIDRAALCQTSCRGFTQTVSRIVYEYEKDQLDGIHYASRHGSDIQNWAIFCGRAVIHPDNTVAVSEGDPDFRRACTLLNIAGPQARSAGV